MPVRSEINSVTYGVDFSRVATQRNFDELFAASAEAINRYLFGIDLKDTRDPTFETYLHHRVERIRCEISIVLQDFLFKGDLNSRKIPIGLERALNDYYRANGFSKMEIFSSKFDGDSRSVIFRIRLVGSIDEIRDNIGKVIPFHFKYAGWKTQASTVNPNILEISDYKK